MATHPLASDHGRSDARRAPRGRPRGARTSGLRGGISVQMFGAISVRSGDRRLEARDFGGVKPKQVLEILLLARGHPVPKDRLAELLWGEKLPQHVTGSLESYVSVLRRRLVHLGSDAQDLIVTEPGAYRFAAECVDLDLDRFDELIDRAARAKTPAARRHLEKALQLACGDPLEDEPYAGWAEELRRTYHSTLQQARLHAAEAALEELDLAAALAHADAAIEADAFDERAYRAAMLALYGLGDQHHALDVYIRCRSALAEQLGVEPMQETRALHNAILRQVDVRLLLPGVAPERASLARPHGADPVAAVERGDLRLLAELVGRVPGTRAGFARCTPVEGNLLHVLARALRDALDGHFVEPLSVRPLVRLLRRHAPIVLVLDDLHFAEPSSVSALGDLQRGCEDVPVAVVAAFRPGEVAPDHPLHAVQSTATLPLDGKRVLVVGGLEASLLPLAISACLLLPFVSQAANAD